MRRSATISRCGRYRYALRREWDGTLPTLLFIGLNPSTADHTVDDNTIRRCISFAHDWGFGSLAVGNLFAFRTRSPRALRCAPDPVGPRNDRWLTRLVRESDMVLAGWGQWGAHVAFRSRAARLAARMARLYCLGITSAGMPRHPLYVRSDTRPSAWIPND